MSAQCGSFLMISSRALNKSDRWCAAYFFAVIDNRQLAAHGTDNGFDSCELGLFGLSLMPVPERRGGNAAFAGYLLEAHRLPIEARSCR